MKITGQSILGFSRGENQQEATYGINPATGDTLQPAFYSASTAENCTWAVMIPCSMSANSR